jgi:hypothetical protein
MDFKTIIPQINRLASLLEQYTQTFEERNRNDNHTTTENDHQMLSRLLNNYSDIVTIPSGRYIVHESLVLDRFNTSKRIRFEDDAIVFFDFPSVWKPAFVVNSNNCTITGGTLVANGVLLEVNGDGNVFHSFRGLGETRLNGRGNALDCCCVISSSGTGVCFGENKGHSDFDATASVNVLGPESYVKNCLFQLSTNNCIYVGIDYEKWTFDHAYVLVKILELFGDKLGLSYNDIYTLSGERLSMLRCFLSTEKRQIKKHARRITVMLQGCFTKDDPYGFCDKFFTMLERTWHPDMEVFIYELFVLWETKAQVQGKKNIDWIRSQYDHFAKLYAIDKISSDVDRDLDPQMLVKNHLFFTMGFLQDNDVLSSFERKVNTLWIKVRDQMIEDTYGLNELQ